MWQKMLQVGSGSSTEEVYSGDALDFNSLWSVNQPNISVTKTNITVQSEKKAVPLLTFLKKVKKGNINLTVTRANLNGLLLQYCTDDSGWTNISSTSASNPVGDIDFTLPSDAYIRIYIPSSNYGDVTYSKFMVGQ